MAASVGVGVKSGCADTIRFGLTILFIVLLRYQVDRILNVLISDLMLVQDALQEFERVRA